MATTRRKAAVFVAVLSAALGAGAFGLIGSAGAVTHHHSHHHFKDSDHDGMSNAWERAHGLRPFHRDAKRNPDHDGLTNLAEFRHHTNPQKADTDRDGLSDGVEVHKFGTDPRNADTDADGIVDGQDDSNGDGLPDEGEDGQIQDGFVVATILHYNADTGVLTFMTSAGYPLAASVTEDTKIVFGGEECEAAGSTKDLVEGQDVLEMHFGDFEAPDEFPPLEKIVLACPTD